MVYSLERDKYNVETMVVNKMNHAREVNVSLPELAP